MPDAILRLLEAMPDTVGDPLTWAGLRFDRASLALRGGLVAGWIVAAIVAALVAPRRVARGMETARARPLGAIVAGVLAQASLALAALLAAGMTRVPIAGWPLIVLVSLAFVAVRGQGLGAAFAGVGARLLARSSGRSSAYADLLLGALACGAFAFVPVAGPLAWMLAASAGTGGVIAAWRTPPVVR